MGAKGLYIDHCWWCACVPTTARVCGGQRTTCQERVLSFHHVGSGVQTQVVSLGTKYILPTGPSLSSSLFLF